MSNKTLYLIILMTLTNCKNKSNDTAILNSFNEENTTGVIELNLSLVSMLTYYEQRIDYTDTTYSKYNNHINTIGVIQQYEEDHKVISNPNYNINKTQEILKRNHEFLVDSIIIKNMARNRKHLNESTDVLKEKIETLGKNYENEESLTIDEFKEIKSQLFVKNQIFYNQIFQLIMRHKLECEFRDESFFPIIAKKEKLNEKTVKLEINLCTSNADDAHGITLNHKGKELEIIEERGMPLLANFTYDPNQVEDTLFFECIYENRINKKKSIVTHTYLTQD